MIKAFIIDDEMNAQSLLEITQNQWLNIMESGHLTILNTLF